MSESNAEMEMPKYKCHKEVWALQIGHIDEDLYVLHFEDKRYSARGMRQDWWMKHNPEPGGYLVAYKDGYLSFSPKDAFDDGYTLMEAAE